MKEGLCPPERGRSASFARGTGVRFSPEPSHEALIRMWNQVWGYTYGVTVVALVADINKEVLFVRASGPVTLEDTNFLNYPPREA